MTVSEWHPERLDLDAYLARIGYDGPRAPTGDVLRELHRAHTGRIPFENLDIVLGRGISLDLDDLQQKMVETGRGGYCLEHATLFGAVVDRFGFGAVRLSARVAAPDDEDKIRPRTHALLRVDGDGGPWIADIGFGFGVREPVPLAEGAVSEQGPWAYRMERYGDGWRLRNREADGTWTALHSFVEEPQHWIDYVVTNHFVSTHPSSPFAGHVMVMRTTDEHRQRIRGRELFTVTPDGRTSTRTLTGDELVAELRTTFGIVLDDAEAKGLAAAEP